MTEENNHPALAEEAIAKDALIWYEGRMAMSTWSCPAVITRVFPRKRQFLVMSLDDMEEQTQEYDFDVSEHSPTSRLTMRPASHAEVRKYLRGVEAGLKRETREGNRADAKGAREKLKTLREMKKRLSL